MSEHDIDTVLEWRGCTVVDGNGDKIGKFEELYLDGADRPAWAAVTTGLFGTRQSFVPLADATRVEDGLRVPFDKDRVKAAPSIDPDEQLGDDEELALYRHYGLTKDDRAPEGIEESDPGATSSATADRDEDDGDAMTRSEEELVVDRRRRVRGRARLKKYVVTEHVQKTVPVQREEVRVEYEPASDNDAERDTGAS